MSSGYYILKASEEEAPLLSVLAAQTFFDAYVDMTDVEEMKIFIATQFSLNSCLAELRNHTMEFYIAFDLDQDAGYFMLNKERKPEALQSVRCIELSRIYTRKEYRGKKLGKMMLDQAIHFARRRDYDSIWLQVWEENLHAIEFYKRNGFVMTEFKMPYRMNNRIDWDVVMVKQLKLPKLPEEL